MRRKPEEDDIVERAEKQEDGTQKGMKEYWARILFAEHGYGNDTITRHQNPVKTPKYLCKSRNHVLEFPPTNKKEQDSMVDEWFSIRRSRIIAFYVWTQIPGSIWGRKRFRDSLRR
jgi:hypothetical protein